MDTSTLRHILIGEYLSILKLPLLSLQVGL